MYFLVIVRTLGVVIEMYREKLDVAFAKATARIQRAGESQNVVLNLFLNYQGNSSEALSRIHSLVSNPTLRLPALPHNLLTSTFLKGFRKE